MKRMKLAVCLALALALCIGLMAGCSGSATPTPAPSAPAASSTPAPAPEKTTLTMGTNAEFPPYEFYEGGAVTGIDAEIAAAIAGKLGMELVIEDMEFDSIISSVKSGKIDMGMAGMTVTDERLEEVNFTTSYATGVQVIIVPEDSAIASVDDSSSAVRPQELARISPPGH